MPAPGQTWRSVLPPDADREMRRYFRLLDAGLLEAWCSETGSFHVVWSPGVGPDALRSWPRIPNVSQFLVQPARAEPPVVGRKESEPR